MSIQPPTTESHSAERNAGSVAAIISSPPGKVTLEFISTGTLRTRTLLASQPVQNTGTSPKVPGTRNVLLRRFRALTDAHWTDPLPIGTFLIRHPDGPVLFDTGESPRCNEPGFFSWRVAFLTRLSSQTDISAGGSGAESNSDGEGVVAQLRTRGVEPADLQAIVLSHLHHDHTGGLADLVALAPDVPVYVGAAHWAAFGRGIFHRFWASFQGAAPEHWPAGFAPRLLQLRESDREGSGSGLDGKNASGGLGPWGKSCPVTADGRVVAVETSGHVPGHMSLVVYGDTGGEDGKRTTYLLTGDATYGIELLDREEPDGVNDDPVCALETLRTIKQFAREQDVVVLPSHDPDTPRLLRDRVLYKPTD